MKKYLKKITPLYKLYLYLFDASWRIRDRILIPGYETKRKIILDLSSKYGSTQVFIETGTYLGDTVDYLKDHFNKLYSIEVESSLFRNATDRFLNYGHIKIVNGDSAVELRKIMGKIDTSATIWLDGHYSSEFFEGEKYMVTGKGEKITPVFEELQQINDHPVRGHVILIDDARLFNGKDDYPEKEEVKTYVRTHMPDYSFSVKNDIIRILPRKL